MKGRRLLPILFGWLWLCAWADTEIFLARLETFEPERDTIVLKRLGRPEVNASLHKRVRLWLNKQPVSADQFQQMVGQQVMVRMSVGTATRPIIREMADPDTWKWLEKVRRGIIKGVLVSIESDYLIVEFPDKQRFAYKFTQNTRFTRNGKPATIEDFAVGETLYIAPRLLSNLDTMALAVSNMEKDAQIGRERSLPTVSGTLLAIDRENKMLRMRTRAGDLREFRYDDQTVFTLKGKPIEVERIKPPVPVTVHRKRDEQGNDYARRVTIQPEQKKSTGSGEMVK
ncbi:MAG: hypothetical protein ABDI19_01605 [Armatimonadota bacterium]